jgi:hypothetical protein
MRRTLGQQLVPVADCLRDLLTQFGLRPYTVNLIHTRWSGGSRGVGQELIVSVVPILPTPKIADLSGVQEILSPAGLAEVGEVMLTKVSGRFTEEQLRGVPPDGAAPLAGDLQFFYEVQWPELNGQPGDRRRFFPVSAPYYDAPALQWRVQLRRQRGDRARNGDPTG